MKEAEEAFQDYILNARPRSGSPEVFLRLIEPERIERCTDHWCGRKSPFSLCPGLPTQFIQPQVNRRTKLLSLCLKPRAAAILLCHRADGKQAGSAALL